MTVTRIELAPETQEDIDRIIDHLYKFDVADRADRILEIIQAIDVLQHNPLIGRLAKGGRRELVIGRRSHGYVALYEYIEPIDTVFVLAVRAQSEVGYVDE